MIVWTGSTNRNCTLMCGVHCGSYTEKTRFQDNIEVSLTQTDLHEDVKTAGTQKECTNCNISVYYVTSLNYTITKLCDHSELCHN
jgi:hypothetical protein